MAFTLTEEPETFAERYRFPFGLASAQPARLGATYPEGHA